MSTIASCTTQAISGPVRRFRIIPAGLFRARDGRPQELPGWVMDGAAAQRIIAATAAYKGELVIDYEHQTLNAQNNPGAAPAAGWLKTLEWVDGDGLYVTDARWTARASAMIDAKEYRYISPVFAFDKSGNVTGLHSIALTNNPALDGLTDLAAATRKNMVAMKPCNISESDHAVLQQVFGNDYAQCAREHEAAACRSMPSSAGITKEDELTFKHVFGQSYVSLEK